MLPCKKMNKENSRCRYESVQSISVKRETGVNPVRSRHCKSGVWKHGVSQSLGNREGVSA